MDDTWTKIWHGLISVTYNKLENVFKSPGDPEAQSCAELVSSSTTQLKQQNEQKQFYFFTLNF